MVDKPTPTALVWHEELTTGVAELDEQHQSLFLCVAELEKATGERTMLSTFHALAQLRRYAQDHFAEEEKLMRLVDYPEIDTHIVEHRDFSHRLAELGRTYLDHDISTELIVMLRNWLARHVAELDMDYVPYLAQRNARHSSVASELGASA